VTCAGEPAWACEGQPAAANESQAH